MPLSSSVRWRTNRHLPWGPACRSWPGPVLKLLAACLAVLGTASAAEAQSPYLVKDIKPAAGSSSPGGLTDLGGVLLFTADDGTTGTELWKSDGTSAGTTRVKDIQSGAASSFGFGTGRLTNVNGTLFFLTDDGASGIELWKSDGTGTGTVIVKDIYPGAASPSAPSQLTNVNGTLFFSADDGTSGYELWKSDGTAAGTVMVKDISPGVSGSFPSFLTNVNGTLFFIADDGTNGYELWKSDGTGTGTVMVKDILPGPAGSYPSGLTNVNGTLFLSANDGTSGYELWKSNGTAAGTVLVKDINAGAASSPPYQLTVVNGTLFFSAVSGLWKSDGTAAGTVRVKVNTGTFVPWDLTDVNGTLFLTMDDGSHGVELWKSDGTTAGTVMVKDIWPGANGSDPQSFTNVGGELFFTASDGANGQELWRSDGTAGGTTLVQNINPGAMDSDPRELTTAGTTLFFSANDGTAGRELWAIPISADLGITKGDGATTATPGTTVTYTITVTNGGPNAVAGARVTDTLPAVITGATWTCVGNGGGVCPATGTGNINHTVSVPVGASLTYTLTGTISPSATGSLSNTATVADPVGVIDPDPTNNSATDTDTLLLPANLSITKTDGQTTAAPGQVRTYTIVASNAGPNPASGATVTDTVPAALTGATWSCVGAGGGTCTASGGGNISDTVNLPVGGSVAYTLTGTVSANPINLRNTATVAAPAGMGDPNLANNTATDEDMLLCFSERIVVPDGRLTSMAIGVGTTGFAAALRIGNAYSLEVKNTTGITPPGTLTVFSGDAGCSGATLTTRDTTAIDPGAGAASRRVSFTATGTETFFRASLNTAGAVPLSVSWSDTTLYSPAWSTNGAFNTFYSFENTTGALISGTLTLMDTTGAVLSTFPLSIPAGQATSTNTQSLGVVRNRTGTAKFTHDGPPGAVVPEAAIANFSISPAYVQPVKFQAVREAR